MVASWDTTARCEVGLWRNGSTSIGCGPPNHRIRILLAPTAHVPTGATPETTQTTLNWQGQKFRLVGSTANGNARGLLLVEPTSSPRDPPRHDSGARTKRSQSSPRAVPSIGRLALSGRAAHRLPARRAARGSRCWSAASGTTGDCACGPMNATADGRHSHVDARGRPALHRHLPGRRHEAVGAHLIGYNEERDPHERLTLQVSRAGAVTARRSRKLARLWNGMTGRGYRRSRRTDLKCVRVRVRSPGSGCAEAERNRPRTRDRGRFPIASGCELRRARAWNPKPPGTNPARTTPVECSPPVSAHEALRHPRRAARAVSGCRAGGFREGLPSVPPMPTAPTMQDSLASNGDSPQAGATPGPDEPLGDPCDGYDRRTASG